jgi:sodium/potassium-transporting ATPase subunit beta
MGKKAGEKSFGESVAENLRGFGQFLYNSEEGTVLGRTGSGWARISIFYLFYYLFLAALFAISINITLSCLNKDKPYFQTRLQVPGLTIQPKLPSKDSLSTDIFYSRAEGTYEKYVTQLDTFLEGRDNSSFGACGQSGYGYAEGKPCIFLKVNKIIGWVPHLFIDTTAEEEVANEENRKESKAPSLNAFLAQQGIEYKKDLMFVSCYALKKENAEKLGKMTVYPTDAPGLPKSGYPYIDASDKKTYKSPIIAIQLEPTAFDEEIGVGCKAYARNILDDARTNAGFIHFKINIK